MGLYQTKKFDTARKSSTKQKRPRTEWEKIFTSDRFDKGLISKIYKELIYNST